MLLKVSVDLSDTPERTVTPVNDSLWLNDSTVMDISSSDMDGTKHSMLDILYLILLEQRKKLLPYHLKFGFEIRSEDALSDVGVDLLNRPPAALIHLIKIWSKFI